MPSPNGYIDSITFPSTERTWSRITLNYDANNPPWDTPNVGSYTITTNIGPVGGPYTLATTTTVNRCNSRANPNSPTGLTSTEYGIGGPDGSTGALTPGTAYEVEIVLNDPSAVEVDRWTATFSTDPYPTTFSQSATNITTNSADVLLGNVGQSVTTPAGCESDQVIWDWSATPGGPYTSTPMADVNSLSPSTTLTGLPAGTQIYWRARLFDDSGDLYYTSPEATFTTEEEQVTTPPFNPQPCNVGGGSGEAVDLENLVLCDTLADGSVVGTALAVYDYSDGNANAAPTFVDPATGVAYVPQGTLMPCPGDAGCLEPVAFHRTTTSTAPVEHPGRQYDITLPINPGFAVQSMQVDAVTNAANIVWEVDDPDGETFRQNLTTFMEGRLPAPAVVTITNPNAGQTICGTAAPMQIHIECLRLDQSPPDLVELIYNGGQDMILNPAYNETPPLNPPVSQGNYGYHLLARQDDPGPFPGNPPANRVNCTNVANRGWETNDIGRTFEIWGQDVAGGVTPTPRGTPVQEITSDGPPPGGISTIWQTFQAPASGNFIIRVVHGARDAGEIHRITLDNGDTDDAQNGTLINDVTTPATVYGNPWTVFNQTIPLTGGSTYTLALSSTENPPDNNARGGLFTDMRAYIDRPDQRATATTDDDTCVVTVEEESTVCTDELWSPICAGGNIDSWQNAQTGQILSNAAFWGQAPAPIPGACPAAASGEGGGSVNANLAYTYQVCAVIGGVRTTLQRVLVTDGSGGVLADSFIGPDGGPVPTPTNYTIGSCTDTAYVNDVVLCDFGATDPNTGGPVSFIRKYVQSLNDTGQGQVNSFRDFDFAGQSYTLVGPVGSCSSTADRDRETVCWTQTSTGGTVHTGTIRHDDALTGPATPGWILFDQNQTPVPATEPGLTFVPCGTEPSMMVGLCLGDGTPLGVVYHRDGAGAYIQDGWVNLLTGAFTAGDPPVGTVACGETRNISTSGILCSVNDTTGDIDAIVLVIYQYDGSGNLIGTSLVSAVDGSPYVVPAGHTVTVCPADTETPEADLVVLCDANGSFLRDYRRDQNGVVVATSDYDLAGNPYVTSGTVQSCVTDIVDVETLDLCDVVSGVPVPFLRRQTFDSNTGALLSTTDTTPAGAPYVVAGTVARCTDIDTESQVLCDIQANGTRVAFLRRYSYNAVTGLQVGTNDTTLNGSTPYAVTGTVGQCPDRDSETFVLCDSAATPNRFLRTYTYNSAGSIAGFTDTTFAGAAFVPTGAVGVCATTVQADTDFVEEILCDSNGTSFIRLFRFNSTTGALVSTTNTTLAGAAFAPVGTVGLCSDCCPQVIAEDLCTNTGSGRGTAIRATNGTVTLIDSVSGAAITQANIVACASDDTPVTATAQARTLTNATPWTPGADVVGTLLSLTVTGTSGLWDMVDQSGTVLTGLPAGLTLTWSVEDNNTLTGPQSITPQAGATVVAHWTQR